jgi:hypothetical protein
VMQQKIAWPGRLRLAARWGRGGQPPVQEGISTGSAGQHRLAWPVWR